VQCMTKQLPYHIVLRLALSAWILFELCSVIHPLLRLMLLPFMVVYEGIW
jgi:hypothetical protein